jgi:predicted MFS family arabinose efflux permease
MSTEPTAAEAAASTSPPPPVAAPAALAFTPYQKTVVGILAFLNFTIILDFMIISPLGALLLRDLHIPTKRFGLVVSAYAFSAAISGILSAGYADKFDRKKLLMFFYVGFIAGTLFCGLAPTYELLLAARIVTGIFGGVIGSIAMAIIADLFPLAMRGRVMGVTQTAFAASQVLGLPLGWTLANHFGWHAPFLMIAGLGAVAGVFIMMRLKPIDEHLKRPREGSAFKHLYKTLFEPRYIWAFLTTIFLATGPLIGRFADRSGKYFVFAAGTALTVIMAYVYTHLGRTPLGWVVVVNALLFMGVTARMISATALMTAVPDPSHRGSFMSINTAVSQGAGGVGAFVAGLIVVQQPSGALVHYDTLGYVVIASMLLVVVMLKSIDRMVSAQRA